MHSWYNEAVQSRMARTVVMELENDVLLNFLSRDLIRENRKKK